MRSREWRLSQITFGAYGHNLNHRQVFSPGGRYAYYDTRNADPDIVVTNRVERVDLVTLEVDTVYRTQRASAFGPGVGAVVCHPHSEQLLFLHGLDNCDSVRPYSASRRYGAVLNAAAPDRSIQHAESRIMDSSCELGSLRGGTHAHSWSCDGLAASFTYNDAVVEERHRKGQGPADLRTVGVMHFDCPTKVSLEDDENFSGSAWSMLVAPVHDNPGLGIDELESAREECWLGRNHHAVAFIGRVRTLDGRRVDEVFFAEWPCEMPIKAGPAPLDDEGRLVPPAFVSVRRVTHTIDRRYPGIDGPRHWLLASPDGASVYCNFRDDQGIVQLFAVDLSSGHLRQLTDLQHSIASPLAIDSLGHRISLVSNGRIGVVDLATLECVWLPDVKNEVVGIPSAVHFLPGQNGVLFHAIPRHSSTLWQQLWTLTLQ